MSDSDVAPQRPELIFLLEERSAKRVLNILLKKLLPEGTTWKCIPHSGKSDLRRSIPIVMQALCRQSKHQHPFSICIACKELEAWYWGDLDAVARAFPGFKPDKVRNRAHYRSADTIQNPANELARHIGQFSKSHASQEVPKYMDTAANTSLSFCYFIKSMKKIASY